MVQKYGELAQKLRSRAIELDSQLKNLTKTNSELISKCEKCLIILKEFTVNETLQKQCSVCCQNESTHIVCPCGHGNFCESCSLRSQRRNRCFTCRGTVENTMRIYL